MAIVNGSFASPLANAQYPSTSALPSNGLFFQVYNGINGVSLIIFALLMLVAYDQCEVAISLHRDRALILCPNHRQIYLEQRLNRRPGMEGSFRGTFPRLCQPKDG